MIVYDCVCVFPEQEKGVFLYSAGVSGYLTEKNVLRKVQDLSLQKGAGGMFESCTSVHPAS